MRLVTHGQCSSPSTGPGRALRAAGLVALLTGTAFGATACASLQRTMESYSTAPNGLSSSEDRLRRTLSLGRFDSALARAGSKDHGAPGDRLLRSMYAGLVAYYAGEYDRSAAAFERVYAISDDRLTRRVSKEAASLVTNDRALPWTPSPAERLLGRHFAMLAFLRRNDVEGAVVEARRLVQLLQELDDAGVPVDRSTRAMLHYVAGTVFEAGGEHNDADVAWRNAALHGIAAPERAARDDSATVLVLVEHGWIAHKVEQSLTLAFGTRDEIALYADDDGRRAHAVVLERELAKGGTSAPKTDEEREEQAADSTLRAAREKQERQVRERMEDGTMVPGMRTGSPRPGVRTGTGSGGTRPSERAPQGPDESVVRPRSATLPPPVRDAAAMEQRERETKDARQQRTKTVTVSTNASPAERLFGLLADEERGEWYVDRWDRPVFVRTTTDASHVLTIAWPAFARPEPSPAPMAVRAYAGDSLVASDMPLHVASLSDAVVADFRRQRGAVFARAVARAATKYWLAEKAEKKEKWAGMLVNAAGDLLERADTRSWHLLPGQVSLVRLRVPAGSHNLTVDVADPTRGAPAHLELGTVTVRAGDTRVVSGRVWAARMPRPALPAAPRTAVH